jgi:hypothetical protein
VLVPEWVPLVDVPDITFRVTQDVDGDGDEETIYSEGYYAEAHAAVFALAGASPQGACSFSLYAASRAFNPEQASGFVADWNYDPAPNYVVPSLPVAVVNA